MTSVGSVSVDVVPSVRGFRERLSAELRNLPSVEVVLDTVAAHAKIDELRVKLAALSGHVRVDVDTAAAQARLAALQAQLDALRRGASVNVNGNFGGLSSSASSASANAVAKITLIGVAILALIPLAAAASIAIAGIGAGLAVGIGGALVGALALRGVGSALSASRTTGGGGGGTSRAQQLETQRQAEVGLAVAQRDAAQAQRDLTQARADAQRQLDDLTDQIIDNGLAQRQAALTLSDAARDLSIAQANPDAANPANADALAQVQLNYDKAKRQVDELAEAGSRLAVQRDAANAAGVEGADNVVQAQNRVVDTQNALIAAQNQTAAAATGAAGGLSAYDQALAKLNPAQQQFVHFIESIRDQLGILKSAATNSFLPLLQQAITTLLPALPAVAQLITVIGTGFGQLAVRASQALTGPFWTQFLAFITSVAGPAIKTFGSIFGNLFTLVASAFQQAWPLIQQFGTGLANALGAASSGVQGGALGGFFGYIRDNAPQLKATLKEVGSAIGSIFQSLAPLAGPALKAIGDLAKDFAAIVKFVAPVVKALLPFTPLILGIVVGIKAFTLASAALNVVLAANPIILIIAGLAALTLGLIYAYQHSQNFRDVVDQIGRVLKNVWDNVLKPFVDFLIADFKVQLEIVISVIQFFIALPDQITKAWGAVTGFFSGLWADITGAFTSGYKWIVDFVTTLPGKIAGLFSKAGTWLLGAGADIIKGLLDGIRSIGSDVGGFIGDIATDFANGLKKVLNDIVIGPIEVALNAGLNAADVAAGPFINFPSIHLPRLLAAGGEVAGFGGPRADNIMAMLSPGEFVINAQAYANNKDLVQQINSGGRARGNGMVVNQTINTIGLDEVAVAATVERRLRFASV